MLVLTAHQPVYLPWLGLFHKIALADRFVSYDHVPLSHYDFIARNIVRTIDGPCHLIVPVKRSGGQPLIRDTVIDNTRSWRSKHWRTIEMSYRKARFFPNYAGFLEEFYKNEWVSISEMNTVFLGWALSALGIQRKIESSSSLSIHASKSDAVLEMSRKIGADIFIFGELGVRYADVAAFKKNGVIPVFQQYIHPIYNQIHGEFISHLSIIDLLLNCGPGSRNILMSGNVSRTDLEREMEKDKIMLSNRS